MRISSMLAMTFFFFLVEIIAGQITKSISLTTDAFHMLSDALALCIGLFSIIVSLSVIKFVKYCSKIGKKANIMKPLLCFCSDYPDRSVLNRSSLMTFSNRL
jgi:spore maturation protein SpmA